MIETEQLFVAPLTLFASVASKVREGEMRSKQVADNPKTLVVILDTGDEILSSLKSVARTEAFGRQQFQGDRCPEQCRTRLV